MNRQLFFSVTIIFSLFMIFLFEGSQLVQVGAGGNGEQTAVYLLAFDNNPNSNADLSKTYTDTVNSIVNATTATKRAFILADLGEDGDTHILLAENQLLTPINGLPDETGQITAGLAEYNMADGATLGGFLIWAFNQYPTSNKMVTYVGHGAPLAPETNIREALGLDGQQNLTDPNPDDMFLPPLPIYVDVNPDITDYTNQDLVTPHDLAQALQALQDAGIPPIDLLDLVHCFSSSIEELYEIAQVVGFTGAPMATTIVASPNYTFFAPEMLGDGLDAWLVTMTPETAVTTLIQTYDQHLSFYDFSDNDFDIDHPRILVGIDTNSLPSVKEAWDNVAYHLLQDLPTHRPFIQQAYSSQTVNKYDTTFCQPQDFALEEPDALVDMHRFARELSIQYPAVDPIHIWAEETANRLQTAVIATTYRNGQPWFAEEPRPTWDFENALGISLYADLVGQDFPENEHPTLSWHAHWYTSEIFTGTVSNEHPYAFVQGGILADGVTWSATEEGINWSDLFIAWWQDSQTDLPTAACLPSFPPLQPRARTIQLPIIIRQ